MLLAVIVGRKSPFLISTSYLSPNLPLPCMPAWWTTHFPFFNSTAQQTQIKLDLVKKLEKFALKQLNIYPVSTSLPRLRPRAFTKKLLRLPPFSREEGHKTALKLCAMVLACWIPHNAISWQNKLIILGEREAYTVFCILGN